jgi:hypothetical protein
LAGSCECGDEPSGSGTTKLVFYALFRTVRDALKPEAGHEMFINQAEEIKKVDVHKAKNMQ